MVNATRAPRAARRRRRKRRSSRKSSLYNSGFSLRWIGAARSTSFSLNRGPGIPRIIVADIDIEWLGRQYAWLNQLWEGDIGAVRIKSLVGFVPSKVAVGDSEQYLAGTPPR
jgi:hypothetical protein